VSYLADAHREWHYVNGAYNSNCPLDCGAMSPEAREAEDLINALEYEDDGKERTIRCAHCSDRHATVDAVRLCADLHALRS
jgi:hypothetical protein